MGLSSSDQGAGSRLLDSTGAVYLSQHGIRPGATDISAALLALAQANPGKTLVVDKPGGYAITGGIVSLTQAFRLYSPWGPTQTWFEYSGGTALFNVKGSVGSDVNLQSDAEEDETVLHVPDASVFTAGQYIRVASDRDSRTTAVGRLTVAINSPTPNVVLNPGEASLFTVGRAIAIAPKYAIGVLGLDPPTYTLQSITGTDTLVMSTNVTDVPHAIGETAFHAWGFERAGQGEVSRVVSRDTTANTITIRTGLTDTYRVSDGARVAVISYLDGVHFEGVGFKNLTPGVTNGSNIKLEWCRDPQLVALRFQSHAGGAIAVEHCLGGVIEAPRFYDGNTRRDGITGGSFGYGVSLNGCTEGMRVNNPKSWNNAATVTTNPSTSGPGVPRNCWITNGVAWDPGDDTAWHTHATGRQIHFVNCSTRGLMSQNGFEINAVQCSVDGEVGPGVGTGISIGSGEETRIRLRVIGLRDKGIPGFGRAISNANGLNTVVEHLEAIDCSGPAIFHASASSMVVQTLRANRIGMPNPGTSGQLVAQALAGATSLTLFPGQGARFSNSQVIRIGNATTGAGTNGESKTIQTVSGDVLSFAIGLANDHQVGDSVVPDTGTPVALYISGQSQVDVEQLHVKDSREAVSVVAAGGTANIWRYHGENNTRRIGSQNGTIRFLDPGNPNVTNVANANYTILPSDQLVQMTTLTTSRNWPLPALSTMAPGQRLLLKDASGSCSATKTITATANGSDTIEGAASMSIAIAYGFLRLRADTQWMVE